MDANDPTVNHAESREVRGPFTDVEWDETACVEEGATIGPGTHIGRYSHIKDGATVGADCELGQNVVVAPTAVIGNGVKICSNIVVEDGVVLEGGVFCGSGVAFATMLKPRRECLDTSARKRILVERGASLGANATILGGCMVREYAMIGAGALVTQDVPRYAVVAGAPASQAGWLCRCTQFAPPFRGSIVQSCPVCGRHYQMESIGPREYSPEEDRAEHHARCFRFLERVAHKEGDSSTS